MKSLSEFNQKVKHLKYNVKDLIRSIVAIHTCMREEPHKITAHLHIKRLYGAYYFIEGLERGMCLGQYRCQETGFIHRIDIGENQSKLCLSLLIEVFGFEYVQETAREFGCYMHPPILECLPDASYLLFDSEEIPF